MLGTTMNDTFISPEASVMTDKLADRAFSVYLFISRLPSPLSEFTFRQVIEDAYNCASVLPKEIRIEKALEGICEALFLESESFDALLECLGISLIDKEDINIAISQNSKAQLLDRMKSLYETKVLPPKEGFMDAYDNFSNNGFIEEEAIASNRIIIREKLAQVYMKYGPSFFDESAYMSLSPFEPLGYKTFFYYWLANDEQASREKDRRFYRWYCQGDLLGLVFDVVYRGTVTSVSRGMLDHIRNECKKDYYFNEVVQEQFKKYREFNPTVPPYEFYTEAPAPGGKGMESSFVPALPKIKMSEEAGYLNEQQLSNLYKELLERDYLDVAETPPDAFKNVFSGEGKLARPIKWNGQQKDLAAFLMRAKKWVNKKDYAKTASHLFVQKNGKPCQVNTLNQPDYSLEQAFNNIFEQL